MKLQRVTDSNICYYKLKEANKLESVMEELNKLYILDTHIICISPPTTLPMRSDVDLLGQSLTAISIMSGGMSELIFPNPLQHSGVLNWKIKCSKTLYKHVQRLTEFEHY